MNRLLALAAFVSLSGCGVSDEEKIQEFKSRCLEYSSEFIIDNSAVGAVNLGERSFGIRANIASQKALFGGHASNLPIGSADLPVLDHIYGPSYVLERLLLEPTNISEVRYKYNRKNGKLETQSCYENTRISVKTVEQAEQTFLGVCDIGRVHDGDYLARYNILYAYGEVDEYDIRSFMFWVNDRASGQVLAEQISFQLLLGGLSGENKVLKAWGGAQGVRSCNLSPPDQLVKRVFRKNA